MDYLLSFLEGIITFISPCLLPMLPVYVLYFTGEQDNIGDQDNIGHQGPAAGARNASISGVLRNACAFVLGFTVVFLSLGAFAGVLGSLLVRHQNLIQLLGGIIIIFFGFNYLGLLPLGKLLPAGWAARRNKVKITGALSAFLFGLIFSVTWTPCVGAFLGSALVLAANKASAFQGIIMLLCYSVGLGIPFIIAALLIHQGKASFALIKRHLPLITKLSGGFLILMGVLMATGYLGALLSLLSLY
ncbi:MAG: cytochrome c biogenesis protein CcdA [Clostridiales bacterium]